MEQLTNEEKAKVTAMYWGVEAFHLEGYGYGEFATIHSMHVDMMGAGTYKCCLGLTPLSSITDEHAIEVAKILNPGYLHRQYSVVREANRTDVWFSRYCVHIYFDGSVQNSEMTNWVDNSVYQYLISRGYDVPLWFGVGHPCNGMTAIQLGIAIDKNTLS